jgi:hypothetical protein
MKIEQIDLKRYLGRKGIHTISWLKPFWIIDGCGRAIKKL